MKMTKLLTSVVFTQWPLKGHWPDPTHLKGASSLGKFTKPLFNPLGPSNFKKNGFWAFWSTIFSVFSLFASLNPLLKTSKNL